MLAPFLAENRLDDQGRPAGGIVEGTGLLIRWQDGPLGRGAERQDPNGAFVETVIAAAKQRLDHYQSTQFACEENHEAAGHLAAALAWLQRRTAARELREVEGTHEL